MDPMTEFVLLVGSAIVHSIIIHVAHVAAPKFPPHFHRHDHHVSLVEDHEEPTIVEPFHPW